MSIVVNVIHIAKCGFDSMVIELFIISSYVCLSTLLEFEQWEDGSNAITRNCVGYIFESHFLKM